MNALSFHLELMQYKSSTPENSNGVEVILSLPIDYVPVTGIVYRDNQIVLLSDTKYPPLDLASLDARLSKLFLSKSNLGHQIVALVRDVEHEIIGVNIKRSKIIIKCL